MSQKGPEDKDKNYEDLRCFFASASMTTLLSPLRTTQSWRWPQLTVSRGQEKGSETALSQHKGSRLNFTALQDPANMFALYFWFFLQMCIRFAYWLLLLTSWSCQAGLISCVRKVHWSTCLLKHPRDSDRSHATTTCRRQAMMSWEPLLPHKATLPPETGVEFIVCPHTYYITTPVP